MSHAMYVTSFILHITFYTSSWNTGVHLKWNSIFYIVHYFGPRLWSKVSALRRA